MTRLRRRPKRSRLAALTLDDAMVLAIGPDPRLPLRDGHVPLTAEMLAHVLTRDGPERASVVADMEAERKATGRTPDDHPEMVRLRDLWAEYGPDLELGDYPWALRTFGAPAREED